MARLTLGLLSSAAGNFVTGGLFWQYEMTQKAEK